MELIGDSGEKDPEIYRQVVQDFPNRVRVIYIRNVTSAARRAEVQALAEDVRAQGGEMLLVLDTEAAVAHAAARGFIASEALAEIRTEKTKDTGTPSTSERLLSGAS